MPLQIILGSVILLGCILAVILGLSISDNMGLEDYLKFIGIFSPFFLVLVLAWRKYWVGFSVGLIPLGISIPVVILQSFGLNVVFGGLIFAFVLGGFCFRKFQKPVITDWASMLIMAGGYIVWARVLYDRPGSALLGGSGGGAAAIVFSACFGAYWSLSKVTSEENWKPLPVLRVIFALVFLAFWHRMIFIGILGTNKEGDTDVKGGILYNLYSRPGWLLGSIVYAYIIFRFTLKKGSLMLNQNLFIATVGLIFISLLPGHRRTILFAMGTIMVITLIYRLHWRALFMIIVSGILGLLLLLSFGQDLLSPKAKRTLSIFLPISESEKYQLSLQVKNTEFGWESEFRSRLYALAWNKLKSNPVFGGGFAFSSSDLRVLYSEGDALDSQIQRLAKVGGYHNSMLHLAVGAGIPAGVLVLIGSLGVIWKFVMASIRLQNTESKFFAACIAGMVPPLFGFMLTNGGWVDLFRCFILLAVMNGLLKNKRFWENPEDLELHQTPRGELVTNARYARL